MVTLSAMFCVTCVVFLKCWLIGCKYVSAILFLLRDLYPINANNVQMLYNSTASQAFSSLLDHSCFHLAGPSSIWRSSFSDKFTALLLTRRLGHNFLSEAELDFRWKVFVRVF